MSEYTSLKEQAKMESLIRLFGKTPEGIRMAKLVCKSQLGQVSEEEKQKYVETIEEDLAALKSELEYGCIPPQEKPITPEENERMKREALEECKQMGMTPTPALMDILHDA